MKKLVFTVFFLILAAAAQAAIYEEQIFSSKITSSGTYTGSNGDNFEIELIGDSVRVALPESTLIVKNDTCETSGAYYVCLIVKDFSHYDYAGPERVVNKREVTINTRVAKLNLTREIEKTDFWIGEETDVRMRIQNIGERPAAVSFLDNFSDTFDVSLPFTCNLNDNAVFWKGELGSKGVITCSYWIKAAKAGSFSSSATAAYNNGVSAKTETDAITLAVNDFPLQLKSNISDQTLSLGSEVKATFNITATEKMTIKSLTIVLPDGLRLLGQSGIDKTGEGKLRYEGSLNAGDSRQFTITFAAEKTGTLPIKGDTKLVLADSKLAQDFEREIEANVSVDELYTRITKSNFSSGSSTMTVFVINPSNLDFYNIELNLETGLQLKSARATFPKIENLGHGEFSAEFDAAPGKYPVKTTLAYSSIYGEMFSATKNENVTVSGEVEEGTVPATPNEAGAQESPQAEELAKGEQKTELKLQKSKFSAKAAIIATAIVVVVAGMLVLISAKRKKQEEDEF